MVRLYLFRIRIKLRESYKGWGPLKVSDGRQTLKGEGEGGDLWGEKVVNLIAEGGRMRSKGYT